MKPDFSKIAQKFEDIKGFVWDKMCEDSGNILLYSNVAGYFSSMLAQIWTVTHNEKLSKKDKSYMVPQETTEGLTNISVSFGLGIGIKKLGDWVLETGRKPIEEYREVFKSLGIISDNKTFLKVLENAKNFIEKNKDIFIVNNKNQNKPLTHVLENLFLFAQASGNNEAKIKIANTIDDFTKIKGGMGFLTTLAASIIVFCGIAPILRNKIAGEFSRYIQKEDGEATAKMQHYSAPIYAKKYNFTGLNPLAHVERTRI